MSVAVTHSGGTTTIAAATSPDQPETINFGSLTSISEIVVTGVSAPSNAILYGVKLNGAQLVDSGVSVTNVPSISSTVRANPAAGFSIVSYAGAGNSDTVGHGLNASPGMILVKDRGVTVNWAVYDSALSTPADDFLVLNNTDAEDTISGYWGTTNSSVFGLIAGTYAHNRSGNNYIAYCFAPVEGYSAFGSYTGSTSLPFIFTGFRPAFLMFKRTDTTGNWEMYDTARDTYNPYGKVLIANGDTNGNTLAESDVSSGYPADILSNGFKLRHTGAAVNADGGTYVYMAFAEHPLKTARAR